MAVDIHSHRTDLVVGVPEVQEAAAYDHLVAVVDTVDILVLLVVVDNFAEDIVGVHNVVHLVADEEYIPKVHRTFHYTKLRNTYLLSWK